MASYLYRCPEHGISELARPMGTAPASADCPACGSPAPRVFTAPRLSAGSARNRALIERTESTADAPAVVSGPPPSPATARRSVRNPSLPRLPRP